MRGRDGIRGISGMIRFWAKHQTGQGCSRKWKTGSHAMITGLDSSNYLLSL